TRVALDVRVGASWAHLGTYDAAVVNQALRYAADRRVIATTITPGDGKIVRRVTYLHPALTDTPLGCRIVEADRLVDTFTAPGLPTAGTRFGELVADRREMALWMTTV